MANTEWFLVLDECGPFHQCGTGGPVRDTHKHPMLLFTHYCFKNPSQSRSLSACKIVAVGAGPVCWGQLFTCYIRILPEKAPNGHL